MMKYLKNLYKSFKPLSEKESAYKYLAESYDLIDLERRMKELEKRNFKF